MSLLKRAQAADAPVPQPILPTITSILGCVGGTNGDTAYACRNGQVITITGSGFYPTPANVSIGPYPFIPTLYYKGSDIVFRLPSLKAPYLGVPLAVTLTLVSGESTTYTAGLVTYGNLTLTSITGSASPSGPPTGCVEGDVITLTGSGFNLGQPGDANNLDLRVTSGTTTTSLTDFTVVSNTEIHATLPAPPTSLRFTLAVAAGIAPFYVGSSLTLS